MNVDFIDLYKDVDRFIRDAYSSENGVSEYIDQMSSAMYKGCRMVNQWDKDYASLKRARWIRNQLSHEVGYDTDICNKDDFAWLISFKERLYSANDPLSLLHKNDKTVMRTSHTESQRIGVSNNQRDVSMPNKPVTHSNSYIKIEVAKRKTIWQRIKSLFR